MSATEVTADRLVDETRTNTGASFDVGLIGSSKKTKFFATSSAASTRLSMVYDLTYRARSEGFSNVKAPSDLPRFASFGAFTELCGDRYLEHRTLGARLYIALSYDLQSSLDRARFESTRTKSALFGLKKKTTREVQEFESAQEGFVMSVQVLQEGGEPDLLGGLARATSCMPSDVEACFDHADRLAQYAFQSFPRQLDDLKGKPSSHPGFAVIDHSFARYPAGFAGFDHSEGGFSVVPAPQRVRSALLKWLLEHYSDRKRVEAKREILEVNGSSLSAQDRDALKLNLKTADGVIAGNIEKIERALQRLSEPNGSVPLEPIENPSDPEIERRALEAAGGISPYSHLMD